MRGQKRVEDARKRAYDPGIHLLAKNPYAMDGLHRNSGLPELRIICAPQVG
jgi:hypothetical protein